MALMALGCIMAFKMHPEIAFDDPVPFAKPKVKTGGLGGAARPTQFLP
jgi:hypothetical protein